MRYLPTNLTKLIKLLNIQPFCLPYFLGVNLSEY